jgi:ketosteroid isomerase-like protein
MPETEKILFANEAFYRAFADQDFPAMDELWSQSAPVACIHPGWDVLTERDAIMESWRAIFSNPDQPPIRFGNALAHLYGPVAFVTCVEALADSFLVATNFFRGEDGAWKLVHHRASPLPGPPPSFEQESRPVQH